MSGLSGVKYSKFVQCGVGGAMGIGLGVFLRRYAGASKLTSFGGGGGFAVLCALAARKHYGTKNRCESSFKKYLEENELGDLPWKVEVTKGKYFLFYLCDVMVHDAKVRSGDYDEFEQGLSRAVLNINELKDLFASLRELQEKDLGKNCEFRIWDSYRNELFISLTVNESFSLSLDKLNNKGEVLKLNRDELHNLMEFYLNVANRVDLNGIEKKNSKQRICDAFCKYIKEIVLEKSGCFKVEVNVELTLDNVIEQACVTIDKERKFNFYNEDIISKGLSGIIEDKLS